MERGMISIHGRSKEQLPMYHVRFVPALLLLTSAGGRPPAESLDSSGLRSRRLLTPSSRRPHRESLLMERNPAASPSWGRAGREGRSTNAAAFNKHPRPTSVWRTFDAAISPAQGT